MDIPKRPITPLARSWEEAVECLPEAQEVATAQVDSLVEATEVFL